ncbi:MAG: endonuclease/exonuclease/phosphatase family protein [Pontiellaceae bacterium]|nr:endonuclease/exonuclease/phosphatase family protein [Pontiellaceae bacterium]
MSLCKRLLGVLFVAMLFLSGTANALEVKVMNYNIRYGSADDGDNSWTNRSSWLIAQLKEQAPQVIGMQEALRFQLDEIRAALPYYGEVGIGRDGGEKGEYSCILYDTRRFSVTHSGTFWLSETPEKRSQDWDSACVRICTWALLKDKETGETFYHFNTHLDHQSAAARLNGVRLIAQRIAERKADAPFVLTGDFNAAENSPPLKWLKGKVEDQPPVVLVDTFRVLHPDAKTVGTFNRFRGDNSGAKIDYILTEPTTKVLDAEIDFSMPEGRCISDHYPVTATIRFETEAPPLT